MSRDSGKRNRLWEKPLADIRAPRATAHRQAACPPAPQALQEESWYWVTPQIQGLVAGRDLSHLLLLLYVQKAAKKKIAFKPRSPFQIKVKEYISRL